MQTKKAKKQPTPAASVKKGARKMIWPIIAAIITIFGFAIAVSGFLARFEPRISVSPSFSLNPHNALLSNFEIKNVGNTPIKNVKFAFSIKDIRTSDGLNITGGANFKNRLIEANNIVPILEINEGYTVSFPVGGFNIGPNVVFADLALVINFTHPLFSSRNIEKKFRYIASKDVDSKFHWAPQPLSK